MILAVFPVDWQLTDTYFVVAHMHHVLFGGVVVRDARPGLYYWFPKMSGRMLSEALGQVLVLADADRLQRDLPAAVLGRDVGHAAPVSEYTDGAGLTEYNVISTIGSFILAIGAAGDGLQRRSGASATAGGPAPTRGAATRSSGSRPRPRRSTTST